MLAYLVFPTPIVLPVWQDRVTPGSAAVLVVGAARGLRLGNANDNRRTEC